MATPANLGTFSFNAQSKTNRNELGEQLASITFTPAGWVDGDPYLNLAPQAQFVEKRAAMNAMLRYYFAFDVVQGNVHWYSDLNPSKVGGNLGWANITKIAPENGTQPVTGFAKLGDNQVFVTWPNKRVYRAPDGSLNTRRQSKDDKQVAVVFVETNWVQIVGLGDERVEFKPGVTDEKSGKDLGALLHHYISLISKGTKLTVAVTLKKYTDYDTGEITYLDALQRKALFIRRTVLGENFDWESAREKALADKILFASTKRIEQELKAADPEYGKREDTLDTLSDRKTGTSKSNLRIMLDGVDVSVGDVRAGVYELYSGTNRKGQVDLAYAGGASRLNSAARQNWQLRTVKVYGE